MKKIIFILSILIPSTSNAVEVSTLLKNCAAVASPHNELTHNQQMGLMYCYGLIEGIRTISILNKNTPDIANICFPAKGSDNSDYARVITSALIANPALLEIEAGGAPAAIEALKRAYPCK